MDAETLVSVGVLMILLALVVVDVATTRVVEVEVGGVLVALASVDERVDVVGRVLHSPIAADTIQTHTHQPWALCAFVHCIAYSHADHRQRV